MLEWILSASVLILMIIGLRYLLKGKISLRLQYALWALVLLRLLIPVSFGSSQLSAANAVETVFPQEPIFQQQLPVVVPPVTQVPAPTTTIAEGTIGGADSSQVVVHRSISLASVLKILWICGGSGLGIAIILSNLLFLQKQKKNRTLFRVENHIPVYISPSLDTPCLVGFFRPAVYIPEKVAEDPTLFRHAFVHEMTHYRHGDHLWSVLRAAALCIHWYNPLVWLCVMLSKQDAELACDEGTIRILGEEQRSAYGKTLISLTCEKKNSPLLTATTMTGSKNAIKERISLIVKKPKTAIFTLVSLIFICALVVGCTFTGAKRNESKELTIDSPAPTLPAETTAPTQAPSEPQTALSLPETPEEAIELVFSYFLNDAYHAVLVQDDTLSEKASPNLRDTLLEIVSGYEWEKVDEPIIDNHYRINFGKVYEPHFVSFQDNDSAVFLYKYGETTLCWKLKDRTQKDHLLQTIIQEYNFISTYPWGYLYTAGGYEASQIARQYFEVVYQDILHRLTDNSIYEITDFQLIDLEITGVSSSKTAFGGWVKFAVKPSNPNYYISYFGNVQPGEGEYEGMYIEHISFTMQLQPQGYWMPMVMAGDIALPIELPLEIEEDITPELAVEKIFGVTSENVHFVFFHYNENGSNGFQCKDLTDIITQVVRNYGWTKLENAAFPDQEKSVYFTGSVWENTELRITESGLMALRFGNDYVVWQLSDPGRASEFFMNIRMNAESAVSSTDYLVIPGDTPEEAAENFVKEVYRDFRMSKPSGWSTAITDYKVVDWDIMDVSKEKDAVVAQFAFATIPEDWDSPMLWVGNTREGTGEFEGMLIDYREFVLQLQEDGTWRCTGFGTGGYNLP